LGKLWKKWKLFETKTGKWKSLLIFETEFFEILFTFIKLIEEKLIGVAKINCKF